MLFAGFAMDRFVCWIDFEGLLIIQFASSMRQSTDYFSCHTATQIKVIDLCFIILKHFEVKYERPDLASIGVKS